MGWHAVSASDGAGEVGETANVEKSGRSARQSAPARRRLAARLSGLAAMLDDQLFIEQLRTETSAMWRDGFDAAAYDGSALGGGGA